MAATPFAITATNVTMPTTGNGVSQFEITGIPGDGTLGMSCRYSGTEIVVKIPVCPMTPPVLYTVTAGQTLTGSIAFYPYGAPIPASLHKMPHRSCHLPADALALAGVSMLGFGLRRRARRWLASALIAVGTLAVTAGINACGGNSNAMTTGTYPYTIAANWTASGPAILSSQANTTINVTVP
jgi:Ni,Fe-hydrogenase I small subunit